MLPLAANPRTVPIFPVILRHMDVLPCRAMRIWLAIAALLVPLGVACGARTVPADKPTAALYRDLRRLVSLSVTAGWKIDSVEVRSLQPDALMSVCQVEPARRTALLEWLDQRIDKLGGPVEDAWANRGKKLDKVSALLELTRIRMTLEEAVERADEDCPFWLEPKPNFSGRQIADDHWQLSFGGGGKGILVSQGGREDIYFGGAGRFLFGRAIGERWSLLTGLEGGASASFPKDDGGGRSNLVLGVDLVVPAVVRYRLLNSYLEGELGYLTRFTEDDYDAVPGVHVGIAFGGRASRQRWFFPGAVFGIGYERSFPGAGEAPLQTIKLGFRVAIDIDL